MCFVERDDQKTKDVFTPLGLSQNIQMTKLVELRKDERGLWENTKLHLILAIHFLGRKLGINNKMLARRK